MVHARGPEPAPQSKAETPQLEQLKDAPDSWAEPFVWVRAFRGRDTGAAVQRGPANKSRVHERETPAPPHTCNEWKGSREGEKAPPAQLAIGSNPWPGRGRLSQPGPRSAPRDRKDGSKGLRARRAPADVKVQNPQPRGGTGWANPPARPRPQRTLRAARMPPAHLLDVHVCRGRGRPPTLSFSPPSPFLPGPSARLDRGSPPPPPAPSAAPAPRSGPAHPSRKQNGGGPSPFRPGTNHSAPLGGRTAGQRRRSCPAEETTPRGTAGISFHRYSEVPRWSFRGRCAAEKAGRSSLRAPGLPRELGEVVSPAEGRIGRQRQLEASGRAAARAARGRCRGRPEGPLARDVN